MAAPFQGPFSIQVESWVYNTGIAFNRERQEWERGNHRETKEELGDAGLEGGWSEARRVGTPSPGGQIIPGMQLPAGLPARWLGLITPARIPTAGGENLDLII